MNQKRNRKHWLRMFGMVFLLSLAIGTSVQAASKTVATIGKKEYTSLEKAIKAVKNKQTIVLKKNVTYSSDLVINRSGKKFTLNLNKKKITFKKTALLDIKKGTVTIKNGTITHNTKTGTILNVRKGATLNITDGTYKGMITNAGTLTVTKGTFTSINTKKDVAILPPDAPAEYLGSALLANSGTLTIKGGTFNGKKNTTLCNTGKLTIKGGTFKDNIPNNDELGETTFTGGALLLNYGEKANTTIHGGTFKATLTAVLNEGDDKGGSKMTINNGTFSAKVESVICNIDNITIKGGTFRAYDNAVTFSHNSGNAIITGGTFKADAMVISSNFGSLTIRDGSFTTTINAVKNGGEPLMAVQGGDVVLKGGTFIGKKTWFYWLTSNPEDGTLKINKNKITCKTKWERKETENYWD